MLQRGAEENARLWTFEVSTNSNEFPIKHNIVFDYKLENNRVDCACPEVVLHLPNRVEITSHPPQMNPSQSNQGKEAGRHNAQKYY